MSIKKYTDWRTWWDGLRTNLIKCIGTTGTSWLGSNAIGATVPSLSMVSLNWEQALGLFAVHIGIEVFSYMKTNQPIVITETVVNQSSSTTTVTPVTPETK